MQKISHFEKLPKKKPKFAETQGNFTKIKKFQVKCTEIFFSTYFEIVQQKNL
jgi:hypothetical protein